MRPYLAMEFSRRLVISFPSHEILYKGTGMEKGAWGISIKSRGALWKRHSYYPELFIFFYKFCTRK